MTVDCKNKRFIIISNDFKNGSKSIELQVAMATMHFHILAKTVLFMGIFFSHSEGLWKQFGTNSKLSLGCKVCQIRSRGGRFGFEISLFMMFFFFFIFTLCIRLSLILI